PLPWRGTPQAGGGQVLLMYQNNLKRPDHLESAKRFVIVVPNCFRVDGLARYSLAPANKSYDNISF
ncbi:MAG: hypothetical protein WCO45_15400, partial [Pseudanabaena sp. ELA607]